MKTDLLDQLLSDLAAKRTVVVLTDLDSGNTTLVHPESNSELSALTPEIREGVSDALKSDRSATVDSDSNRTFLHIFNPPLRMVIVGAVHIAQPLARMAVEAGYEVTVVDPRRAFATEERFPGIALLSDWPDDALAELAPDGRTAVVTLTHDPKIDDPALHMALRSPAFYIGSLGSKKTHAARLKRLAIEGFDETDVARIHGPVGLAIGARSPAEIAIAILAQVTQQLRQPSPPVEAVGAAA